MQTFINAARSVDLATYRRGQTPADLTIGDHGALSVTYAPFDFINRSAELVLVGLTPGRTQAANALEALQRPSPPARARTKRLRSPNRRPASAGRCAVRWWPCSTRSS